MRPLWRLNDVTAGAWVCLILIWISFAVLIAKASDSKRRLWIACAILMIPISLLGIRYARSLYFAEVLGAIPLGLVLSHRTRQYPKYMGYSAIALSTGVMLGAESATSLLWQQLKPLRENGARAVADCSPKSLSEAIAPIQDTDAIVMADLNFAPMVLYLSPHLRTVAAAAGYSRNLQGVLDVLAFFDARNDDVARTVLEKRGADFVLVCNYGQKRTAGSLEDRIYRETPTWLQRVGSDSVRSGYRLYRVRAGSG